MDVSISLDSVLYHVYPVYTTIRRELWKEMDTFYFSSKHHEFCGLFFPPQHRDFHWAVHVIYPCSWFKANTCFYNATLKKCSVGQDEVHSEAPVLFDYPGSVFLTELFTGDAEACLPCTSSLLASYCCSNFCLFWGDCPTEQRWKWLESHGNYHTHWGVSIMASYFVYIAHYYKSRALYTD